jgi:hypothetical protein
MTASSGTVRAGRCHSAIDHLHSREYELLAERNAAKASASGGFMIV